MLSKVRYYVPPTELLSIYYAIFSSHMSYGSQVCGQQNSTVPSAISRLQNIAMRIISFSDFNANTDPTYKSLNNKLPSCFSDFFTLISQVGNKSTRNSNLGCLFVNHSNTTKYGLNSINRKCIKNCNFLTRTLNLNLSSLSRLTLKQKVSAYFLNQYQL